MMAHLGEQTGCSLKWEHVCPWQKVAGAWKQGKGGGRGHGAGGKQGHCGEGFLAGSVGWAGGTGDIYLDPNP